VRDLPLERDARPAQLGVEAQTEKLDVLRVREEVLRRGHVVPAHENAGLRAGRRHDDGYAAVVIDEVEAELGSAEGRRDEPEGGSVLTAVLGLAVGAARHGHADRAAADGGWPTGIESGAEPKPSITFVAPAPARSVVLK